MNPNLPPNPYAAADAGFEPALAGAPAGNPYFERAASTPDLEAQAPVLRTSEAQRLNRKALGFLAGIVLLLMLMAAWAFSNMSADDARKRPKQDSEEVRIPELPQAAQAAPAAAGTAGMPGTEPIGVQPYAADAAAPMPPLPEARPEMPAYPAAMPPAYPAEADSRARPLSLMERRMANVDAGTAAPAGAAMQDAYMQTLMQSFKQANAQGDGAPASAPADAAPGLAAAQAQRTGVRAIEHPDALLVRGTYIRCVLETHVVTDVPGFTSCIVTEPVYSINGRSLLLPKGSKVSGQYGGTPNGPRVAVLWDRITTPTGLDVNMASPGVDGLGGAGHPGFYDAHWASRIGSALMISLLSDVFKYEGAKHGPRTTIATGTNVVEMPFESNTARTVQRLADQALDAAASRLPTVTIHQGTVVNIYVARDIDFTSVLAPR